jgi:hypothetical protein
MASSAASGSSSGEDKGIYSNAMKYDAMKCSLVEK